MIEEQNRLIESEERRAYWRRWGPYLSERQWGTVREDYSPHGTAWDYFPHDHARSRAYRWGEDVKEYYFYLDSTPTHSYMKCLYKYPQAAFPYRRLVEENARRGRPQPEYELLDTGVFDGDRYFDVTVEYAKGGVDDLLIRVTAVNRGPEAAELHLLPTLWFRNTWSWDVGA
ncbi:MAG: glucosidase, partial [Candidatus Rokuibacteriota bacterium]